MYHEKKKYLKEEREVDPLLCAEDARPPAFLLLGILPLSSGTAAANNPDSRGASRFLYSFSCRRYGGLPLESNDVG